MYYCCCGCKSDKRSPHRTDPQRSLSRATTAADQQAAAERVCSKHKQLLQGKGLSALAREEAAPWESPSREKVMRASQLPVVVSECAPPPPGPACLPCATRGISWRSPLGGSRGTQAALCGSLCLPVTGLNSRP